MKKYSYALAAVTMLLSGIPLTASAAHVIVQNRTSNAWVWITGYNQFGNISGAYCVNPNSRNARELGSELSNIRGEVTVRNCQHPRAADLWCPHSSRAYAATWEVTLNESNGRYSLNCSLRRRNANETR